MCYAFLIIGTHTTSAMIGQYKKRLFDSTAISDTITRIDEGYYDSCSAGFWIANYPESYIEVDVCKFPQLRKVKKGDLLQKRKNSTACTIIHAGGHQTKLNLKIER